MTRTDTLVLLKYNPYRSAARLLLAHRAALTHAQRIKRAESHIIEPFIDIYIYIIDEICERDFSSIY